MTGARLRVLQAVEAGFCHSRPRRELSSHDRTVADELVWVGYLRVAPRRGRFPKRLVVTASGSHALGTFDSDDRDFRSDSAATIFRARRAA